MISKMKPVFLVLTVISLVGCNPGSSDSGNPGDGAPVSCAADTDCSAWELCSAGSCAINPAGIWQISATTATVNGLDESGEEWDVAIPDATAALPDPYSCVKSNTAFFSCSSVIANSFVPVWNESLVNATAMDLMADISITTRDSDGLAIWEDICNETFTLSSADFTAGEFSRTCTNGTAKYSLVYVP